MIGQNILIGDGQPSSATWQYLGISAITSILVGIESRFKFIKRSLWGTNKSSSFDFMILSVIFVCIIAFFKIVVSTVYTAGSSIIYSLISFFATSMFVCLVITLSLEEDGILFSSSIFFFVWSVIKLLMVLEI